MASSHNQPNPTLYVNNLNDKITKDELKSQLYALFTTYGKIIDIVASKSEKMRGQAFLVFSDLAGATAAMRACEGMIFYDKPLVRVLSLIVPPVYLCSDRTLSGSITPSPSHTPPSAGKTLTSFLQARSMSILG